MTFSFENPFTPTEKRATKRLFQAGDKQKNLVTKHTKEELESRLEQTKVKYGPHEIFARQAQFLKKLEKLISPDALAMRNETASQLLARIIKVKNGNIIEIQLRQLAINQIPPEIGQLTELQGFFCTYNGLQVLPKEIGRLTKLTSINCDNNHLSELPAEIGLLTNLQYFSCDSNQINSLPKEMAQLINLKEIRCNDNDLREVFSVIKNMRELDEFSCMINHLSQGEKKKIKKLFPFALV